MGQFCRSYFSKADHQFGRDNFKFMLEARDFVGNLQARQPLSGGGMPVNDVGSEHFDFCSVSLIQGAIQQPPTMTIKWDARLLATQTLPDDDNGGIS